MFDHIGFRVRDLESARRFLRRGGARSDAFYRAALANGGADNGAPGSRGPAAMKYYGASVLDSNGNKIEAGFRGE